MFRFDVVFAFVFCWVFLLCFICLFVCLFVCLGIDRIHFCLHSILSVSFVSCIFASMMKTPATVYMQQHLTTWYTFFAVIDGYGAFFFFFLIACLFSYYFVLIS